MSQPEPLGSMNAPDLADAVTAAARRHDWSEIRADVVAFVTRCHSVKRINEAGVFLIDLLELERRDDWLLALGALIDAANIAARIVPESDDVRRRRQTDELRDLLAIDPQGLL